LKLAFVSSTHFYVNLPERHFIKNFNPTAAQNWRKKPQKMLFISSTKYLHIRWDGHIVVILVSFVTRSIPGFLMSFLEQHETKQLFTNSTNLHH
jgi:hypothetical protein